MVTDKKSKAGESGIVFDIQRFSLHDGYGIRTLVFLKGCFLSCEWCSNPESQFARSQLGFFEEKCTSCFSCVQVCPFGTLFKEGRKILWEECKNCKYSFDCVKACIYDARVIYGKEMTVEEVTDIVARDRVFYKHSGGGVTLGGGEVSYQPEFATNILKNCKKLKIHTAIETCGYASWDKFKEILKYVDLLMFDIKHMDSKKHEQKTGVGNAIILKNAKKASQAVKEMIIRFPVIPGFNDDFKNVEEMGYFIKENMPSVRRIDVLPYHSIGESKSKRIGEKYRFKSTEKISDKKIWQIKEIFETFNLEVYIGG